MLVMDLLSGSSNDANVTGPADVRPSRPQIVCRQMTEDNLVEAAALLARGFPERSEEYWRRGLERMRRRRTPEGFPRFGYAMTNAGRIVGLILLIVSQDENGNVKGNVSSWYVEPAFRGFSHMLLSIPLRLKQITLFNISPSPNTIETIGAQGFSPYVAGTFHAVPSFGSPGGRKGSGGKGGGSQGGSIEVRRVSAETPDADPILSRHADYGCLCFDVVHEGRSHPFAFLPSRLFRGRIPALQLVYCRDISEFTRFAGPLGRRLLRHGFPTVMLDANGPIKGLRGLYAAGRRLKFYRGPQPPRLGDLSDTELVIFGA